MASRLMKIFEAKLKDRNAVMQFCLCIEGVARKAAARNFAQEQARKILNKIRQLNYRRCSKGLFAADVKDFRHDFAMRIAPFQFYLLTTRVVLRQSNSKPLV
jgi:hypothetical protein